MTDALVFAHPILPKPHTHAGGGGSGGGGEGKPGKKQINKGKFKSFSRGRK